MPCDEAVSVEDARDEVIVSEQYEVSDRCDHVGRGAVALTAPASGQTHLAVDTASPMDHEHDLSRLRIDVGHHLLDDGAHDAFLQPRICRGSSPNGFEV